MASVLDSVLETEIGDNGAAVWIDSTAALPAAAVAAALNASAAAAEPHIDYMLTLRVFVAVALVLLGTRLVVRRWRRGRVASE